MVRRYIIPIMWRGETLTARSPSIATRKQAIRHHGAGYLRSAVKYAIVRRTTTSPSGFHDHA
jgi:hypothetical protein